jgi:N-acyl-D-aspartate/D-glutamate deacylase
VRPNARELVVRNLERAEDIDPVALANGIEWGWSTFPEYLDVVHARPKGINVAANIGHSALRTWAMGEAAFEREANAEELARMADQVRAAMRAGAVGLSTSRSEHHETSDNRPVASRLASWEEVRALAAVMGELGVGMLEGGTEDALSPDPDRRRLTHDWVREIAASTGVTLTCGIISTDPGGYEMLDLIDSVASAGGRMIGQSHCRGINVLLSFATRLPFDLLPEWQAVRALLPDEQMRALRDPAVRGPLIDAAMKGDYSRWRGIGAMPRKPDFDGIRVYLNGLPPNPTVNEVAAARGVSAAEVMIDLALETNFQQLFIQPSLYPQDREVLLAVMRHPRTVMTFSDSGAHLSQIADSSIHTYLLGHWVRDEHEFTLEEAVRMLTLAPATAWGFTDRGLLREGLRADINVFDPEVVAPCVPTVVADLPGGGKRLEQRSVGFRATVVNGQVTIRDGHPSGHTPGRLLRNPLARR